MLTPTRHPLDSFIDVLPSRSNHYLSDVQLEIPNSRTAVFSAKLNGPLGTPVWVRAWLSTDDGTLAEAASSQLIVGDRVKLEVTLSASATPKTAYMRIESAPLKTEHVVGITLNHP
jgi:hypothetical protein